MKITYYTLIVVVISAVTLLLILAITGAFRATATDNANTCAATVLVRATTVDNGLPGAPELRECYAEYEDISGSAAKESLLEGYDRCARMFKPAFNKPIIYDDDTYCHVCGVYTATTPDSIEDFSTALSQKINETFDINDDRLATGQAAFALDEPISIIFYQDRTEELSLLTWLAPKEWSATSIGGLAAAGVATIFSSGLAIPIAAGAGGVIGYFVGNAIPHPEGLIASGIVIRPHNRELVEALGCSTVNVDE